MTDLVKTTTPDADHLADRPANQLGQISLGKLTVALLVVVGTVAYVMIEVGGLPQAPIIILASIVGVYMAMNIGANDVANNMGATVGAGALTITGALVIAAVFEGAGALIAGGDVVGTISKGIIDPAAISDSGQFIRLMLAALLAAAIWLNLATWVGAPVSTTHAIVGGVLGAGLAAAGMSSANWPVLSKIAASWVISPVVGALVAAAFLAAIKATIVYRRDRVAAAKKWVPVLVAFMGAAFAAYLQMKGLKRVWQPDLLTIFLLSLASAGLIFMIVRPLVAASAKRMENTRDGVARLFTVPLICAAALLSFAHGSNDVANAIGPLAAIVHSAGESGIAAKVTIPLWVMLVGTIGLAAGLGIYGGRMIRKIGFEITEIDRIRAFSVALSSAITVICASALALPVSSTHIALGAIFGVGFLREYLENEAAKVRAIREAFDNDEEPSLFGSARAELKRWRANGDAVVEGEWIDSEGRRHSIQIDRAGAAVQMCQRQKLVQRSYMRTIVMAWLITVPATAGVAGLIYFALTLVRLPGLTG